MERKSELRSEKRQRRQGSRPFLLFGGRGERFTAAVGKVRVPRGTWGARMSHSQGNGAGLLSNFRGTGTVAHESSGMPAPDARNPCMGGPRFSVRGSRGGGSLGISSEIKREGRLGPNGVEGAPALQPPRGSTCSPIGAWWFATHRFETAWTSPCCARGGHRRRSQRRGPGADTGVLADGGRRADLRGVACSAGAAPSRGLQRPGRKRRIGGRGRLSVNVPSGNRLSGRGRGEI